MKRLAYLASLCAAVGLCGMTLAAAVAQPPDLPDRTHVAADASRTTSPKPVRPRQPGGLLKDSIGSYIAIEGVLYDGKGKVESNTLVVDTVDGIKLAKPVLVLVRNLRLPAKRRCVLKGYELGEMIGTPPAVRAATRELGQEYVEKSAAVWRWRPYFVVLIAVEPQSLQIPK